MRAAGRVTRAVQSGGGLEAAAEVLADALDDFDTPSSELAGLARELRLLRAAIDAGAGAGAAKKGDRLDDLSARRKARLDTG